MYHGGKQTAVGYVAQGTGSPASGYSGRLPVHQPRRGGYLCRQGQEPETACFVVLHGVERPCPEDKGHGTPDRIVEAYRRAHRTGRPAARKFAHQDHSAALQYASQGRQDLSVDRGTQRAVSTCPVHTPPCTRRIAIFRALFVRNRSEKHARTAPRHLPDTHMFAQSLSGRHCPREIWRLSRVSHRQLQRSVRRVSERRGLCGRHRTYT